MIYFQIWATGTHWMSTGAILAVGTSSCKSSSPNRKERWLTAAVLFSLQDGGSSSSADGVQHFDSELFSPVICLHIWQWWREQWPKQNANNTPSPEADRESSWSTELWFLSSRWSRAWHRILCLCSGTGIRGTLSGAEGKFHSKLPNTFHIEFSFKMYLWVFIVQKWTQYSGTAVAVCLCHRQACVWLGRIMAAKNQFYWRHIVQSLSLHAVSSHS